MGTKEFDFLGNGAWQICVVGVYPGEDLTTGAGEALVDSIGLYLILFGYPKRQPISVALNDIYAAIVGATIDDYVFQVLIIPKRNPNGCAFCPKLISSYWVLFCIFYYDC